MFQVALPGHDASDPALTPAQVAFSTRFRALGEMSDIIVWQSNGGGGVTASATYPWPNGPYAVPPICAVAWRFRANREGQNGGDNNFGFSFGARVSHSSRIQVAMVGETVDTNIVGNVCTFLSAESEFRVVPSYNQAIDWYTGSVWTRPGGHWHGSETGWVFAWNVRSNAQLLPGAATYISAESGVPELRIARAGDDPRTAPDDDLYWSTGRLTIPVIQSGFVDLSSGPNTLERRDPRPRLQAGRLFRDRRRRRRSRLRPAHRHGHAALLSPVPVLAELRLHPLRGVWRADARGPVMRRIEIAIGAAGPYLAISRPGVDLADDPAPEDMVIDTRRGAAKQIMAYDEIEIPGGGSSFTTTITHPIPFAQVFFLGQFRRPNGNWNALVEYSTGQYNDREICTSFRVRNRYRVYRGGNWGGWQTETDETLAPASPPTVIFEGDNPNYRQQFSNSMGGAVVHRRLISFAVTG